MLGYLFKKLPEQSVSVHLSTEHTWKKYILRHSAREEKTDTNFIPPNSSTELTLVHLRKLNNPLHPAVICTGNHIHSLVIHG